MVEPKQFYRNILLHIQTIVVSRYMVNIIIVAIDIMITHCGHCCRGTQ